MYFLTIIRHGVSIPPTETFAFIFFVGFFVIGIILEFLQLIQRNLPKEEKVDTYSLIGLLLLLTILFSFSFSSTYHQYKNTTVNRIKVTATYTGKSNAQNNSNQTKYYFYLDKTEKPFFIGSDKFIYQNGSKKKLDKLVSGDHVYIVLQYYKYRKTINHIIVKNVYLSKQVNKNKLYDFSFN